ncbi:MAG: site-2 protease family protein [Pyrinomonadaceae bacterium]
MESSIKIGRVLGIQLGLHYSWLIIAALVTLSLAGHLGSVNPEWGGGVVWGTAVVTGVFFFASIILHEMGHALVARARGLPVKSITLFALGGVAMIEKESADPATEFWMGIAGPIVSVLIGVLCLLSALAFGWVPETQMLSPQTPALAALVWLGYINIVLAIFNMLPGFPLDGGRVLRAIVWWITGNVHRATRIASRVGQAVAVFFIAFGIFQFFAGAGFGGLWIAIIGWFLLNASQASAAQNELNAILKNVLVGDVMSDDCVRVDAASSVQNFVVNEMFKSGRRCFYVMRSGEFVGIVTSQEVAKMPQEEWPNQTVAAIMRPLEELKTVDRDTPLTDALELMSHGDVNQLPVISNGRFIGFVSRQHILDVFRTRQELQL